MAEVVGSSDDGIGVLGTSTNSAGVKGDSQGLDGVQGFTTKASSYGVVGTNTGGGTGTVGQSTDGVGVAGASTNSAGVKGDSQAHDGVQGFTSSQTHSGVVGSNASSGNGVYGLSTGGSGVAGHGDVGNGGWFESEQGEGVRGHSKNPNHGGVVGSNSGGGDAGYFAGNVGITGNLTVLGDVFLSGADYAEELSVADVEVSPGMVVVLDDEGRVRPCAQDYDDRVAGVISGAGNVRPALVLDRHEGGVPVALMGKLWVLAEADERPIRPGDRLTTSSVLGHARRVADPTRAAGAVVGKALTALESGTGLVRVLVAAS